MEDKDKTKKQLIDELAEMRQKNIGLKKLEIERKQAEEARIESESKYRSLFESIVYGVAYCKIIVDEKNRPIDYICLEINDAFEKLTGLKREDIIGIKATKVIPAHKEMNPEMFDIYGKVALTGEETIFETYFEPLDIWLSISVYSHKKGYFCAVFKNITEKKKAEEALKESEEKLKLSMKSASEGMWEWDFTTGQAYFDDVCLQMLGYNPGEIQKKSEWWWTQWHPDDVAPTKKAVKDYLEGRAKKYSVEFRVRNKSGKYVWIFSNGIVLRKDKNNKPWYMIGIHQNITERKKTEEEVLKSRGELRKLTSHLQTVREEERTSISRELHDDLAQNLAILKINMHMLGKDVPKDQKPILDGLESMMKLTDHMADSVGELMEELRPPLLDELGLLGAIKWYQRKMEEYTEIKCEFHIEPERVDMSDDHNLAVFRILQESLTNVRRHSEATRAKVNLREKDGKLELIVKDNGIGITDEQVGEPKAFGIIGMEERVRHLGGELKIKGVAGKGTTVTVRIPLQVDN